MNSPELIFERSVPGKKGFMLPETNITGYEPQTILPRAYLRRDQLDFPEVSEVDAVRHYTLLSTRNHGVDSGFYPLGSCTMKYNPKINENLAMLEGFQNQHPLAPEALSQGSMEIIYQLDLALREITGMDSFTMQPAAGAHGEFTAMLIIREYHRRRGAEKRRQVLVPTSAHGTNPASAAMAGFEIIPVNCDHDGLVDLTDLKGKLNFETAALMLTNPNTLGLFEREISQVAELVHQAGGLLYYDGANLNAIMGLTRPGDMGFDLMHLNLHKTFATPHGGGGPGAGPVGVKQFLTGYLPAPVLRSGPAGLTWDYGLPESIGRMHGFYGNFSVLVKALAYIRSLGGTGLAQVSRDAVLNANYLRAALAGIFEVPYNRPCMHELVISAAGCKTRGIHALDIAKRLIDYGIHPPTIYFPLIVEEALMIEPTETEDKEGLDSFIGIMNQIRREIDESPELLTLAPRQAPITRVDEAQAARKPVLRWRKP